MQHTAQPKKASGPYSQQLSKKDYKDMIQQERDEETLGFKRLSCGRRRAVTGLEYTNQRWSAPISSIWAQLNGRVALSYCARVDLYISITLTFCKHCKPVSKSLNSLILSPLNENARCQESSISPLLFQRMIIKVKQGGTPCQPGYWRINCAFQSPRDRGSV